MALKSYLLLLLWCTLARCQTQMALQAADTGSPGAASSYNPGEYQQGITIHEFYLSFLLQ